MSETVNVVHDYLRRIDKEMTCDKKKKKQFLQRLQNDMEDFADSTTTTLTENDLEKHFGTPQSIAENFLTVLDKVSLFHRENLAFRPPIHSKGDGDNATVRKGGACLRHRNEVDICTGQNLVLHQEGAAAKGHIISPYLS